MNATPMLRFFSLRLVRVSLIQCHYGCEDDKEHANRVPHQLTIYTLKSRAQLLITLVQSQDRFVPILPCFAFGVDLSDTFSSLEGGPFVFDALLLSRMILDEGQDVDVIQKRELLSLSVSLAVQRLCLLSVPPPNHKRATV